MAPEVEGDADATALRRELRSRLGQLGVPLQILAEDVLGEEDGAIDWVAVEPSGRAWVALLDLEGGDESLLARGLAQRAWVEARLGDWRKLAPDLAVRPEARPQLLLVAPHFSRTARVAAREAGGEGIRLARYRWRQGARGLELLIEELAAPAATAHEAASQPRPVASVFRSGLADRHFESGGTC
jgi:hypothetical protein